MAWKILKETNVLVTYELAINYVEYFMKMRWSLEMLIILRWALHGATCCAQRNV